MCECVWLRESMSDGGSVVVLIFLYQMKHYCYCIIFLLVFAASVCLKVTGCLCLNIFTQETVLLLVLIFFAVVNDVFFLSLSFFKHYYFTEMHCH